MNERDIKLIEAFLDGNLEKEEIHAFQRRLNSDPEFKEEFSFQQSLVQTLKQNNGQMDKESLRNLWRDVQQESKSKRRLMLFTIVSIAAAIAILVVSSVPIWNSKKTGAELADAYFMDYPIEVVRGDETIGFETLLESYQSGNYTQALSILEKEADSSLSPNQYWLYSGICYYRLGQYPEAIAAFKNLQEESQNWDEHGSWYLALSYLKSGQKFLGVQILQTISKKDMAYQRESAIEILKRIE